MTIRSRLRAKFPEVSSLSTGYVVGGAVRDLMMKLEPRDVDISTIEAKKAATTFARSVRGTLVQLGKERFAAYRVVVQGRIYDFSELVGGSISTDLLRRDFSMNAIAFDLAGGALLDPLDGRADIDSRCVRMIREQNFDEDPLRVLKGVRMAVTFDFTIEAETLRAMSRRAASVRTVAPERVTEELRMILSHEDRPYGVEILGDLGLDLVLLGRSITSETLSALARTDDDDPIVAYALLLEGAADNEIEPHAKAWRWSERMRRDLLATRQAVRALREHGGEKEALTLALFDSGEEAAQRALTIFRAKGEMEVAESVARAIRRGGASLFAVEPFLSGDEIQALLGIKPGKRVGKLKRALIEAQLRKEVTTRRQGERFLRKLEEGEGQGPKT